MASTLPKSPTFVLVHGAFHGGWCWRRVAERLMKVGGRVLSPTMTGLGERAHLLTRDIGLGTFIDDVIGVIEAEELDDIILVGHSFGGVVISGVVDRLPKRVRQSIYLDAIVPQNGRSAISQLPSETAASRVRAAEESSAGFSIPAIFVAWTRFIRRSCPAMNVFAWRPAGPLRILRQVTMQWSLRRMNWLICC
jgi:pimeloyl-ACP methyl ester carboxylesterase